MSKRYAAEFKWDVVALVLSSKKTVTEVARDLGVSPEGLRGWVKQAKADRGEGPAGALTSADRGKSDRLLRSGQDEVDTVARCRFIDAEKAPEGNSSGHSVAFLCRVRGVPRFRLPRAQGVAARPDGAGAGRGGAGGRDPSASRRISRCRRAPRIHAALRPGLHRAPARDAARR
ncbi:transposase [Streptomyces paludis]|uniref:Transposase n=1 Tax=Streptomyces paludis TaxID=2282738 RepID=A0A345I179_9ACTN|nr:hypothetical protein DVK44_17890 [Streptomyces paludis]